MAKKKRGPTAYTDEFRREAVRLVEANPDQLPEIAIELGVHPESLRNWRRAVREEGQEPPGRVVSLREENRRLRLENARLKEEHEILKKAAAFFARDTR